MKILVIAPHADDEILGVGGTLAKYAALGADITLGVLTGHGNTWHPIAIKSDWEKVRAECLNAAKIIGISNVKFDELPAACLDHTPARIVNRAVLNLVESVQPHEIYIPFAFDLHKDHGAIAYAVSVAVRPYLSTAKSVKRILAYETMSETHLSPPYFTPGFQPNVYVDITDTLNCKIAAMAAYSSQIQQSNLPRSLASLKALAHFRGSHIGVGAAEGFVLIGEYQR